MDILKVDLLRCKIDCELKKNNKGMYVGLAKGLVGNDGIESIFYLEMDEEAYVYISGYDLNNTLFDISGIMQARKNKNEVPFIYYKVENVISDGDKEKVEDSSKENIVVEKDLVDDTNVKTKKKKRRKKGKSIIEIVKHFELEPIDMSADKIKLTEKKHLKKAIVQMNKTSNLVIIRPLEGPSDEYSLVLGYGALVRAKLLNTQVRAYILHKTRDEIINYMEELKNSDLEEKSEV